MQFHCSSEELQGCEIAINAGIAPLNVYRLALFTLSTEEITSKRFLYNPLLFQSKIEARCPTEALIPIYLLRRSTKWWKFETQAAVIDGPQEDRHLGSDSEMNEGLTFSLNVAAFHWGLLGGKAWTKQGH
jgi:hypothetical protein